MINALKYRGYVGSSEYSTKDEVFHGKIEGIDGLVTFEANNSKDMQKAFEESVDSYIEFCQEKGIHNSFQNPIIIE